MPQPPVYTFVCLSVSLCRVVFLSLFYGYFVHASHSLSHSLSHPLSNSLSNQVRKCYQIQNILLNFDTSFTFYIFYLRYYLLFISQIFYGIFFLCSVLIVCFLSCKLFRSYVLVFNKICDRNIKSILKPFKTAFQNN